MKIYIFIINFFLVFFAFTRVNSFSSEGQNLRIISLAPSTTEILFALRLDEEIVGVTTFCNYPDRALTKEKVGTFSQPDIERILSLRPDMIFATGLEQALTVERLRQLNLKVYVSDPSNMQELFDSIRQIGELIDREKEASVLIDAMQSKIDRIVSKAKTVSEHKKTKVFIEIWHDPLMAAGRGSFVDELVGLAGGINIAYDVPRPYSYFSSEQVIKHNPDCIILGHSAEGAPGVVKKRLGWEQITAVKDNYVYNDINSDLFLRPGPRLVQGLEEIYKRLYPE